MPRLKPTPELIAEILARVPEGFIAVSTLAGRLKINTAGAESMAEELRAVHVERENGLLYDAERVTLDYARENSEWCRPALPAVHRDGTLPERPILERRAARDQRLEDAAQRQVIDALSVGLGYAPAKTFATSPEEEAAVHHMVSTKVLKRVEGFVYDPLRLSANSMQNIARRLALADVRAKIDTFLRAQPGQTALQATLTERFGKETIRNVLSQGGFTTFSVGLKYAPYNISWVCPKDADGQAARQVALDIGKQMDADAEEQEATAWDNALQLAGDVLRPTGRDGKTVRAQVLARTYTVGSAAKRLGIHETTLRQAIRQEVIQTFMDPENQLRLPAKDVEDAFNDPEYGEMITRFETLKAKDIALVCGVSYATARRRLQKERLSTIEPRWGEVRGKWDLPATLHEFRATLKERIAEARAERRERLAELREQERLQYEAERQRREELRARLVAAFPTWKHDGRAEQRIFLHVGPPNSGKTHEALNTLAAAGSGWYLAPLRLLAFEIFDRLNQRGVPCNLLTGEEYIPVPGAMFTAATIEMLNPTRSGQCVVIDEAHMLCDPDRGWAWTRAVMETQAPDIHVIGPPTVQGLVEKLAGAAAIPLSVVEHQRLAPLKVADKHWSLQKMPPRTILVAFSRRMVLQLKTDLEAMKRRVSVVYGNLPPEVRRKQADRFANGDTDICVATDAVGMGLNLPADFVCFYELEKYDGRESRFLTPSEVHQIGGRAGRYGFSVAGEIGATTKHDLQIIQELYETPPATLTHARVAPSVADLEMMEGSLAQRLAQWASLESIPDSLRGAIKTADMNERIELAAMLTDQEVEQMGLAAALKLVNAPARQNTRSYWRSCATALLAERRMPPPPPAPTKITTNNHLEITESCISCADVYLWLARRPEFGMFAPDEEEVRQMRRGWSNEIDAALLRKIDLARRCPNCGRVLPSSHHYRLCDDCFYKERRGSSGNWGYYEE